MAATKTNTGQDFPASLFGRDEMNLAEFPIALPADRAPRGQKTLYFEDKNGRLTVTASDAYGLPTAADTDVIVALIYLSKIRNDFKDVKVNFSRYELIKLLGWQDEGGSYRRLDLSFNRWSGVLLVYDKCWWNNKLKCHTDAKLHIIDSVEIIDNDARRRAHLEGQGGLPLSYFTWNRKFIESCQADNLRQLDLDTYFSLTSAISKRLYRFLGKRFYREADWTFDLNEIAFDRVGLSRSYEHNAGKVKEKLQPAIDELEAIGFLKPCSRDERYTRIDRGQWTIRLTKQSLALALAALPLPVVLLPEQAPISEKSPLVDELVQRGVTEKTALELVTGGRNSLISQQIEVFDWMTEKQDKRVAKSPAGYLVKSITDDYATPKGFITKAERERQAVAKREREEALAASRRAKQEAADREAAERKQIAVYWESLTPEQQAELDSASVAQADPQTLALETGALKRMGQRYRRDAFIRHLLVTRGEIDASE